MCRTGGLTAGEHRMQCRFLSYSDHLSLPALNFFFPKPRSVFFHSPMVQEQDAAPGEELLAAAPQDAHRHSSCSSLPPLLYPREQILLTPHSPDPEVTEGTATNSYPPSKASCEACSLPMHSHGHRQHRGTGRDQLFTWPFQLKLLKLSSAQAGFFCALDQMEKGYDTSSHALRKVQIRKFFKRLCPS